MSDIYYSIWTSICDNVCGGVERNGLDTLWDTARYSVEDTVWFAISANIFGIMPGAVEKTICNHLYAKT
jgi:hypothetical protein